MIADHRPAGFLSRDRHHFELERAAVRALAQDDARLAYRLADRRCRISPLPNSQIYLLRAEALHRLGHAAAAVSDVAKAIEIDPDDVAATRRLMSWGSHEQQQQAAAAIIAHDSDWGSLRAAMSLLRDQGGRGSSAFARVEIFDGEISGWVAWLPGQNVEISLSSDTETYSNFLVAEQQHPLAGNGGCAANFRIPRPGSAAHQFLRIAQGRSTVATAMLPGSRRAVTSARPHATAAVQGQSSSIQPMTVIVPVFADYPATKACLDSLLMAVDGTPNTHVVIVDDATPDADIKNYLSTLASHQNVTILVHPRNLGFVGAINRGLKATPVGDVILLNADTVVPASALARLRDVVTSTPSVGTATPLSNNGEFTSFPIKNKSNPLPPPDRIELLDRLAADANAGIVLDIPNGIGFCLYVTRACLDVVGVLSEDFHRGYMEDVDLCLRAAEAGFRNICVPSVFVGHEGSRSFRQEKRSLVVRNLKVLEQRYPRYKTECAAFLLADPLGDSRGRLEAAVLQQDRSPPERLVFCDAGPLAAIAAKRAMELMATGTSALVAKLGSDGPHFWVALQNSDAQVPQSLRFDVASEAGLERFRTFLAGLAPDAIELSGLEHLPGPLLQVILAQECPYDILIATTELADISDSRWHRQERWQATIDGARHVIGVDADADEFAWQIGIGSKRAQKSSKIRKSLAPPRSRPTCLGIVALQGSADEFLFLKEMGLQFMTRRPDLDVVVIGATIDDLKLMQLPRFHVTGSVEASEIENLLKAYAIDRLVTGLGRPLFGHPIHTTAMASGLPSVRFGWRSTTASDRDLWIAPGTSGKAAAELIADWLEP